MVDSASRIGHSGPHVTVDRVAPIRAVQWPLEHPVPQAGQRGCGGAEAFRGWPDTTSAAVGRSPRFIEPGGGVASGPLLSNRAIEH